MRNCIDAGFGNQSRGLGRAYRKQQQNNREQGASTSHNVHAPDLAADRKEDDVTVHTTAPEHDDEERQDLLDGFLLMSFLRAGRSRSCLQAAGPSRHRRRGTSALAHCFKCAMPPKPAVE